VTNTLTNKITIDKEYDLDNLSGESKNQLVSLQYIDQQLQKLNLETAILKMARLAYVKNDLP
jgi:hypothetical protein